MLRFTTGDRAERPLRGGRVESQIEADFARQLDARKDIKLFFKLQTGSRSTHLSHLQPRLGIVKEEVDGRIRSILFVKQSPASWQDIPKPERDKSVAGKPTSAPWVWIIPG